MTVVGAEFTENESHPYGFDDYTNWSLGPTDYYKTGTNRRGHCTLPYASVEEGHEGKVNLTVTPASNKKAIHLSSDGQITMNPATTIQSAPVAFTPSSGWFTETATVTAKMDDTDLTKLEIVSYKKKNYTCLIVNVISRSTDTPLPLHSSVTKYNNVFKQAVIEFSVSIHDQPFVYRLPPQKQGIWDKVDRDALKVSFASTNPETMAMYDFVVFSIYGEDRYTYVLGRAGDDEVFCFLYAGLLLGSPDSLTAPHEMGHKFGLSNLYTLNGVTPISGPDWENLMNSTSQKKLRKSQWTTIRATHQNSGD
jgi:hypothetical protein